MGPRDYTITQVQRRSEWTAHGSTFQDYAITLDGESNKGWIKLTQKLETSPPQQNSTIHGSIEQKTDKNGNQYWKFTKVNPNFQQGSRGGSGGGITSQQTEYIIQMLEELTDRRPPQDVSQSEERPTMDEYEDPFKGLV